MLRKSDVIGITLRKPPVAGRIGAGIVLFLLLGTSVASAQLPTGAISGRVLDGSGAVIPGTTLTMTSRETARVQTTQTAADGYYKIILPVGGYDVRVEAVSFRPEVRQNLQLEVGQEAVLNFTLAVGSVQETVTVLAEAPLVETSSGSLGGIVNEQRISDLPLNGRNFNDLVLLQPGISVLKISGTGNLKVGLLYSSNGAPIRSNFQVLDGANLATFRGASGPSPSGSMLGVEGIREFRVITNSFPAEYGMTMGSQMAAVSKSGTNQFHGSVFEFLRNSAFDARNFFDRKLHKNDPRLPAFRRNNFGASFGGPIRRDKLFFFATYEGIRESLGITQVLATATTQARQDGFLVPRVAETVKPYLNLLPLPTEPLPTDPRGVSGVGRFTYVYKQPTQEDFGQGRGDYNISERDSAFVRYTVSEATRIEPLTFPGFIAGRNGPGRYVTVAENHTFSPTVLNTFRFSYSRTGQRNSPTTQFDPSLGFLPGHAMGRLRAGSGISDIGYQSGDPAITAEQRIYTWSNDLFWSRGAHSLKFGTLINRFRVPTTSSSNLNGTYTFSSLAQFLAGVPRDFVVMTPGSIGLATFHFSTFGFYAQDDWRVVPNFTLNLGFRYEFTDTVHDVSEVGSAWIDIVHDPEFTVTPVVYKNPSLRNFGPRLGFAWDVFGNATTSLRGGFGLLYDVAALGAAAQTYTGQHPPYSSVSTVRTEHGITFPHPVIPPEALGRSAGTFDYNIQQPHMLHYNLTVERRLPANIALTLSYAGSRGLNLKQVKEGNATVPGKVNGRDFWTGTDPRPNPRWDSIEYHTAAGDSWYNSLQFTVQKRLSRGLQFQSSYTWSKLLDTTQGGDGGDSGGTRDFGLDPSHPSYDKGPADFDTRHSWTFNTLYQLPSTGLHGIGRVLDGWRLGTILTLKSGLPFSPILSGNRSRSLVEGGGAKDRPDLISGRDASDIVLGGPNRYFDPSAYSIQAVGFLGTSSRNFLPGPGVANWDFSLTKEIPFSLVGEGARWEFRAEIFNLLNRANFSYPIAGATVYTADQTRATTTPLSTAGTIDRTNTAARQIQLGLKLVF